MNHSTQGHRRHHDPESRVTGITQRASIDRFIPRPDVRTRHAMIVHAPADIVFDVAERFDLQSIPIVRGIFQLRAKLMRGSGPPLEHQALVSQMTAIGWRVLARTPGRELVAGAVTQPWLADVQFRSVPAERFADFAEPNLVKIVWTLEAEPLGPALTRFGTETRAIATDDAARRKFRAYWRWASLGILPIRWLALPAMRREAERRYRESTAG